MKDNGLALEDQMGLLVAKLSRITGAMFRWSDPLLLPNVQACVSQISLWYQTRPFKDQRSASDLLKKAFILILNMLHFLNHGSYGVGSRFYCFLICLFNGSIENYSSIHLLIQYLMCTYY